MALALFGSLAWALDNLPPHSKATTFAAILCGLLLVALLAIYSLIKQNADHDRQQDGGTQNNQIIPLLNAVITEFALIIDREIAMNKINNFVIG